MKQRKTHEQNYIQSDAEQSGSESLTGSVVTTCICFTPDVLNVLITSPHSITGNTADMKVHIQNTVWREQDGREKLERIYFQYSQLYILLKNIQEGVK